MKLDKPLVFDITDALTLTVTDVLYASRMESRQKPYGENDLVLACVDQEGRTGHIHWEQAWEKRDVVHDALATDQPAWVAALSAEEATGFPGDCLNVSDYDKHFQRDGAYPDCTIECRDNSY